ncbi:major capsid family protein [Scandinavium sp.]|uniref:major capsid family protein n=1 Tax=Scandinavium sp. TaxID=2830653 RepID=UPI00289670B2|nr:major capsid family protein [Scandinavium sp.]
MAQKISTVHKRLSPAAAALLKSKLRGIAMDSADNVRSLAKVGIHISDFAAQSYAQAYGMDAAVSIPGLTVNASQGNSPYMQFLQSWLPGQVQVITAARKADELMGVVTAGAWEDEEVIQEILELVGVAQPYTDYGNIPLSSWNLTYEKRGVIRFEEGIQVGELEGLRSGRIGVDSSATKRNAASLALEISRNRVAFYGYNGATSYPIYGYLNDPNLPAYITVSAGAAGATWDKKTYAEIVRDLLTGLSALRTKSKEVIDPTSTPIILSVASDKVDYLSTPNDLGETPYDWLKENYANVTVKSAIELNDANGGADVFYLYAESVGDSGTDGGGVIDQIVPSRFRALGVTSATLWRSR